ncbi:MAG TPA: EamA family transporter [Paucimonas sp.]|nr:EamA family transporter [Paucimonas sp.]
MITILLTVYGQMIVKWRVMQAGQFPDTAAAKISFLLSLLFTPWILSVFVATFVAGLCWMAAMTKLGLSHAYPFVSLTFVLVAVLSAFFFNESLSFLRILGLVLIVAGVIVGSQG